ncbi:MAG: hypothetical protein JO270_18920 [Acidobacteriaceae bacterium]|nr:hypothetical protein [Acidobacteriaceae bacterium]
MGANKFQTVGLALCLLSTAAVSHGFAETRLSIIVYDAARVRPKTLARAEHLAGVILATAGISPSWDAGSLGDLGSLAADFTAYDREECDAEQSPAMLRVQILPRAPAGFAAHALGLSLPCAKRGVRVTIYADRISHVTDNGGPTFDRTLAYVFAHELGHVLLRSATHARAGLMKGTWSKTDWQRAAVSVIPFTPSEVEQIAAFQEPPAETKFAQLASLRAR